jgi:hypothetical protein
MRIRPTSFSPEGTCVNGFRWEWFVVGKIGAAFIEKRRLTNCWRCRGAVNGVGCAPTVTTQ